MPLYDMFLQRDDALMIEAPVTCTSKRHLVNDKAYHGVALGLLKVVRAIQWVKPGVQEKGCPVATTQDESTLAETLSILCHYQVYLVTLQMAKSLYDTVRGNNRYACLHDRFQTGRRQNVSGKGKARVHYERV